MSYEHSGFFHFLLKFVSSYHKIKKFSNGFNAEETFVGYLLLNAWVGNSARHHENWAFVSLNGLTYLDEKGKYEEVSRSSFFPDLAPNVLLQYIAMPD